DGPYRPGGEVPLAIEIREGIPRDTTRGVRARGQGAILGYGVVQAIGGCTTIVAMRSVNPSFRLAQEAVTAAGQWRFRPGMRRGQPVPVLVTLEIEFVLR